MAITAAELLVKVGADTSDAESGLKSFSGKMKNIGGQMASVGGVLSATIAAPLIGIAVASVKTAADFEKSMNVLGYASNATAEQMQALSDQALQLGADTVFSANEAAEGMVDLAKAGMSTADIMGAIPGVMDLAAAGQIGVSEAANLTAAALSTFNLEATDAAHVADVLAAAANASTADVADLAFGMQNAGSVFAANGQSLETLATMMALLSNNGIKASDAATSLKTMTMMLTAPTAKAAKVMRQLGLSVFDAEGNMRDYHDIVADLSSITKDMSDAQRDAAFATIFGNDATRAAIIMSDEGVKGYEAMATAVSEQGAAANMAQAQNSGLAGTIEQITGSINSLMTKLALPFLDDISAMGGQITTFVNQIGELPQPVINAALAFGAFAVAFSVGLTAIGGAMLLLAPLGGTMGLIALAVLGLAAATAVLWAAWELNIGGIQGTLAPLIAAMQSAGTAFQNFGQYVAAVATSGEALNIWLFTLPPAMSQIALAIGNGIVAVQGFAQQLSNLGQYLLQVVLSGTALNIWLFTMTPAFAAFALAIGNGIVALQSFATAAAAAFSTAATSAADFVTNFKMPDLNAGLQTLKSNVEMQVKTTVRTVLDAPPLTIKPFPPMTIDPPTVTIPPIPPQTIKTSAKGVTDMLDSLTAQVNSANWSGAGQILGDVIVSSWNAEVAKIAPFLTFVNVGLAVTDAFGQFQTNFVGALLGLGVALGTTGIVEKITALGEAIVNGFATMWTDTISRIMSSVMKPPADATSLSDTLRDQVLGADFKWDIPKLVWADWIDQNDWATWIVALTWTAFVAMLSWANFVSALSWASFVSNLGWNSYVPELSWSAWINPLNWGDFISGLILGGGGGGGSSGGSGTDQPQHLNPNDPRPQGFSFNPSNEVGVAGMGGDSGGITINVNVASINNGMDVEVLAAQLARRFQQKLRL